MPVILGPDARVNAFRTIADTLLYDPGLEALVKTWRTWDGSSESGQPPALGQLPWVRLTPRPGPSGWSSTGGYHDSPLLITVETAVEGLDWDDSARLWAQIEAALFPATGASELTAVYAAAGINALTIEQPAIGINDPDVAGADQIIYSLPGLIRVDLYIATPVSG